MSELETDYLVVHGHRRAIVTRRELQQLRSVEDVVRLGQVRHIGRHENHARGRDRPHHAALIGYIEATRDVVDEQDRLCPTTRNPNTRVPGC